MVLVPEDIPMPNADDLGMEILTDQVIDFDEMCDGRAGDLRSDWWKQEPI